MGEHLSCFQFLAIANKGCYEYLSKVFVWTYAFIFSKSRMAMSFGRWIFKCIRICQLFYKEFYNFTLPPVVYEHSRWSISLPILGMASLFSFRHLKRCIIGIHYSFKMHLSNHIWPWAFFMYFFFAISASFGVKCLRKLYGLPNLRDHHSSFPDV